MSMLHNAAIKLTTAIRQWRRRRKLKFTDFTIISNNCWAATAVYQPFGLKYNTPTVGLFIMDEDYIRMLENLEYYLKSELTFIEPHDSKYYDKISAHGTKDIFYPIAKLGNDVEIHFLHYRSRDEARQKWIRRVARINHDKLLIKMSLRDKGYDHHEMLQRFLSLPFANKVFFIPEGIGVKAPELIVVPELTHLNLFGGDETEYTLRRINVYKLLNSIR